MDSYAGMLIIHEADTVSVLAIYLLSVAPRSPN